jgi:hypothetical protein
MPTKIVRHEIYDDSGLVEVIEYEVEDTLEQDIIDKEQQLLNMYNELQELKSRLENN